ncbi:MAG: leukotoxin LktA family filamentous adhesin, partial [Proteobacteria bacterium]|nr:leukotoxin LktA family filamentous adhesin [Pseudomonadota bacterium]
MNAKFPSSVPSSRLQRILGRSSLAASISVALGVAGQAWAASTTTTTANGSTFTTDGKTSTTIGAATGGRTGLDITSGTTSSNKKTDFNSFGQFDLHQNDTVNFVLSSQAKNVVNLVWDSQAVINGTVNSYVNNKIGGNVFFADPHGIVVGSTGVLNVGSLSLSAPTQGFMDSLLNGGALDVDGAAMQKLLLGQEPLAKSANGNCLICVNGTINANNAVRIRATAIDVDGTIQTAGSGDDILATAVNVEGSATPTIVNDGNTIRLIAEDSDTNVANGVAVDHSPDAAADARITIGANGRLLTTNVAPPNNSTADAASWGEVSLTASAKAAVNYSGTTNRGSLFKSVSDLLKDQDELFSKGLALAGSDKTISSNDDVGGQLAYVTASATAKIDMGGTINAADGQGKVELVSRTETEASTKTPPSPQGTGTPDLLLVNGMYGAVYSKADTIVGSGASITGKDVSATAATDNTLEVTASTIGGGTDVATTVAWSQAAVGANVDVGGKVDAEGLTLDAHNKNDFSTEAKVYAAAAPASAPSPAPTPAPAPAPASTPVGIAGAISLQTVKANATLSSPDDAANPGQKITQTIGAGGLTITAATETEKNLTEAATLPTAPATASAPAPTPASGNNANLTNTLASKSNQAFSSGNSVAAALPFKVGAAVSYTDSNQSAHATIGDGAKVESEGNVAVHAGVEDAGIHGAADSRTQSKATPAGSAELALSAAVNYGNYVHDADAEIGKDAEITALNIGVGSDVSVPFDWTFGFSAVGKMGDSLKDFTDGAKVLMGLTSKDDPLGKHASGYAGADAAGAPVDIGGSVNYFSMDNHSRAWVGDGAKLTSTAAAAKTAGSDGWTTMLEDGSKFDWAHSLAITADSDANAFNMVGQARPWAATTTEGETAAVGGAFNYTGVKAKTEAGVGSGAALDTGNDVLVQASGKDTFFTLSPIAGKGGTASLQGTVAIADVDDATHATVSAAADVTARALAVQAENPLMVWALSGAVALSNKASIGISIGVNNTQTDTIASIGDNSGDDAAPADPAAPPAQTGGTVKVSKLDVLATSKGEVGGVSVAGSAITSPSPGESKKPDSGAGSGLVDLLKSVTSATKTLQTKLKNVDSMFGSATGGSSSGSGTDTSMLGKASGWLGDLSKATSSLTPIIDKASALGGKGGGSKPTGSTSTSASFGVAISGAASVNMAALGSKAELVGAHIDNGSSGTQVTVQAINSAQLASAAGSAALSLAKGGSGGDLAGAVAYSSVSDSTTAAITGSTLANTPQVAVHALDGSEQTDIGVGAAVNTGGGNSVTLAGSVSVAQSKNTTSATISSSTLDGGAAPAATDPDTRALDITAYDHSRIGVGAGSLSVATGGNNTGVALGLTYSDISNSTSASLTGHAATGSADDIGNFGAFNLRALDSSLIGAGVLSGKISGGSNGNGLSGAFIWNQIGNSTTASIDGGVRINVAGDATMTASSVAADDASVASLNTAIAGAGSLSGYDFSGNALAYSGTTRDMSGDQTGQANEASLQASGWGSSIIAVAGDVAIGGNNVGLSFVGSQVKNTHRIDIGNATLNVGNALTATARDNTRIIDVAAGLGVTTGQFAGMGSVTYNDIANTDAVRFGSMVASGKSALVNAAGVDANAGDVSKIYSLAGNVAIGTGAAAAGGAVAYNNIANSVTTQAGNSAFSTSGAVNLGANNSALIMSGAVAGAVSAQTGLALSFGWNQTGNTTTAGFSDGSVFKVAALDATATNASEIDALAGSVGIGGRVGVGLAATVADIDDTTSTSTQDSALAVTGAAKADAQGTGKIYSLAVAGSAAGNGAGSGSLTYNTIGSDVKAFASGLHGVNTSGAGDNTLAAHAKSLSVNADNSAAISSLAGAIGVGGYAGIGIAVTIADIGGKTSATLADSVLDISDATNATATTDAAIKTLAVGGAGGAGAVAGSSSTNLIHNSIDAGMSNVGSDPATDGTQKTTAGAVDSHNITTVAANNNARIDSLAGAVGYGGSAVGAAVAVNRISTSNDAYFNGGADNRGYRVGQLTVDAGAGNPAAADPAATGNKANINTIAVGAAVSGGVSLAGSLAVNIMTGENDARIGNNANGVANGSIGVRARNDQGINVFAGAAALQGQAGIGLGVVVNSVEGNTNAGIYGSNVTAYGNDVILDASQKDIGGLLVDDGGAAQAATLDSGMNVSGGLPSGLGDPSQYTAPDLSSNQVRVHGLAVNASNQQHVATMGLGVADGGIAAASALVGVNQIGGQTHAVIDGSTINRANYSSSTTSDDSGSSTAAGYAGQTPNQQVDVRAGSRQYAVNWVASGAASGEASLAGAAAVNVFDADTSATIRNASVVKSTLATHVVANAGQWSLASAVGAGASDGFGGAASAGVNLFKATTHAGIDGGTLNAGGLDVLANSHTSGGFVGGALGLGLEGVGIAGTALVNVDDVDTSASIDNATVNTTIAQKTTQVTDPNTGTTVTLPPQQISDGKLNVTASNSNSAQARAGGAGVGKLAGVAGVAIVNVVGDRTHAGIAGSTVVSAGGVAVSARDAQALDVASGVLGAGTLGLGGGLNLSLLQADVGAQIDASTVTTQGDVSIAAQSDRTVNSQAVAIAGGVVSLGASVGVLVAGSGDITDNGQNDAGSSLTSGQKDGKQAQLDKGNLSSLASAKRFDTTTDSQGNSHSTLATTFGLDDSQLGAGDVTALNTSSSFNLNQATGTSSAAFGNSDGIQSNITGSTITAGGHVDLKAGVSNSTSNSAGSYAFGGVAMGGAVAYTSINTDTEALVDGASKVSAGNGVAISAQATDGASGAAAETQANIGVGGLVGIGAGVAISKIDDTVKATANGTIAGGSGNTGTLDVNAADHSSAKAGNSNPSVNVSGVAIGAVVVKAERKSTVTAQIANTATVKNFAQVQLSAIDDGALAATGVMGAGGIGAAGIGVDASARDSSSVSALIGAGASVNATNTVMTASASPSTTANARGIGFSGAETIGVNLASADVSATVNAEVGDGAKFTGGGLAVHADATPTSTSTASGGAGSIAVAINAAESTATNNSTISAKIGNGVTLPDGDLSVTADGTTRQVANASGVAAAGVVAAGNIKSTATSNVTITASIGDGNGALQTLGKVDVAATGTDTNDATSNAGSGALFGGNASKAETGSTSTTTATIGKQLNLAVDSFGLRADHKAIYGGKADSFNVALAGGSGAEVANNASSTTNAGIGDGSAIASNGDIVVHAQSAFGTDANNDGATGGSGGVISGSSAKVATTLTASNTALLGSGSVLTSGLQPVVGRSASLDIIADTVTDALNDQASQTVKGVVPVAVARTELTGNFTSNVNIGDGSKLNTSGRVDVATYAGIDNMGSQALSNTGGVGTVATAHSEIGLTSNQSVAIGNNVNIFSAGEADVVAGRDIKNIQATRFNPTASAQSYARGLIAIPHASAKATVNSNANLTMGSGSTLTSGDDVAIGSMIGQSDLHVDGTGHGYEVGFIPVTQTDNTQSSTGSANTAINGAVMAGKFNKVDISIDAAGNVTDNGSTAPVSVAKSYANPIQYLSTLRGEQTSPDGFDNSVVPIYAFGGAQVGAPIAVAGGNVYLYGGAVSGNGNITAKGAPSVTINNASTGYLFLPTISTKFGTTGQVLVSGGADINHLGGIAVSQAPSDAQPSITIKSSRAFDGVNKPGIAIIGDVNNLGGSVNITDLAGSFTQFGGMYANSVTLNVPNGVVTIGDSSKPMFAGNDPRSGMAQNSWLWGLLGGPNASPENAAAAIAQYVFNNGLNPGSNPQDNLVALNQSLLMNNWSWSALWDASKSHAVSGAGATIQYNGGYTGGVGGCIVGSPGSNCMMWVTPNPDANSPATERTPVILYGNCAAYTNGGADGCHSSGDGGIFNQSFIPSDEGRYANLVPYMPLWQAGNMPSPQQASSWTANQLVVKGSYININAPIFVGTPATWTVQTTDALKTWISQQDASSAIGGMLPPWLSHGSTPVRIPMVDGNGNPLLKLVDIQGHSQLIGATYDPVNHRILLDNVNAAGNGSAVFDGRIVSTGGGSVHVSSGYGSVTVQNDSGTPLVVNNIFAGNGGRGLIEFIDRQKTDASNNPLRTWYVSDNGEQAKIYSNAANRAITDLDTAKTFGANGGVDGNTSYAPQAGMQYVWSSSVQVSRGDNPANPWSWIGAGGGTAGVHWSDPTSYYRLQTDGAVANASGTAPATLGGNDYVAVLTGGFKWIYDGNTWHQPYTSGPVHYHGCDDGTCHYGTHQTSDGTGSDNAGDTSPHSRWDYIYPLAGELDLTVTQRADKAIAINFDTSQASHVTLGSNADLYLNGVVSNTHGPTYINTTNGGSIIQGNDKALVWTHELSMSASGGGSIGSAINPILAKIVHDGGPISSSVPVPLPTNVLMAGTDGGSINVNVDSGNSDQAILAVAGSGGKYGDVNINGTGSLVGLDATGRAIVANAQPVAPFSVNPAIYRAPQAGLKSAAGNALDVIGRSISLQSAFGSIGDATAPLGIATHPDTVYNGALSGGILNAHAYSDIAITNHGGDIWAGGYARNSDGTWKSGIVSDHGDVTLAAPDGGIYDARLLTSSSTLTPGQAKAIWDKLHLTDGEALQGLITGIGVQVDNAYAQYWQLHAAGSVDGAGTYTLNSDAVPVYFRLAALKAGIDPATVTDPAQQAAMAQDFASARYTDVATTFATYIGSNWQQDADFASRTANYHFVLDPASQQYQQLVANSTWTENQLKYAINVTALATPTGGQVGSAPPNISGRNVSLVAGNGGIGRVVAPLLIKYADLFNGNLTQDQASALAMANSPGDAVLKDAGGTVLTLGDSRLDPRSADYDPNLLQSIWLRQTNPLYVDATGAVSGSASRSVYMQSNVDLHLDGLTSGNDMRLAAGGSIDAAPGHALNAAVLTAGGDATLTAGSGHVSFGNGDANGPGDALPVQVNGTLLSGSANTDLILKQIAGDLRLGTAFANGLVWLSAPTGSILATLDSLSILARNITLDAQGDIGRRAAVATGVDAPLKVQVGSDGLINATAGGAINIDSPQFALHIGSLQSGNDLIVSADNSGIDAQKLASTGGKVAVTANGDAVINDTQAATGVDIAATGALNAGTVASASGDIKLNAVTGMTLGAVDAANGNVGATISGSNTPALVVNDHVAASGNIDLVSSGTLAMASGSRVDAGQTATLTSASDMVLGTVTGHANSGKAINITSGGSVQGNGAAMNLQARNGGSTSLQSVGDIGAAVNPLVVDVASLTGTSSNGSVWLRTLGDIAIPAFTTPLGSLWISGQQGVGFGTLATQGTLTINAGAISGGSASASDIAMQSGSTITLDNAMATNAIALDAATDVKATTLQSGGDTNVTAGGSADIAMATVSKNLSLTAGTDAHLGQGNVGGTSTVTAGHDLAIDGLNGDGTLTAKAGNDATLGNVVLSAGDANVDAGANLAVNTLQVQSGNAALISGQAMTLGNVVTSGNLSATAGDALQFGTLQSGGDIVTTSQRAGITGTQATAAGSIALNAATDVKA